MTVYYIFFRGQPYLICDNRWVHIKVIVKYLFIFTSLFCEKAVFSALKAKYKINDKGKARNEGKDKKPCPYSARIFSLKENNKEGKKIVYYG